MPSCALRTAADCRDGVPSAGRASWATQPSRDQHALRRAIGDGTVLVIGVDPQLVSAAAERRILDSAKPSSSMTDETTWLPV